MNKRAFIPISALMGALLLAVIAAMTPFVAGPDLVYAQSQLDRDTTLFSLSVTGTGGEVSSALEPAFVPSVAPTEDGYTVYADNSVTGVTVAATASHTGAAVAAKSGATEATATTDVDDTTTAGDNAFSGDVTTTDPGKTVILITVTAADDVAMAKYKVTVVKAGAGDDNTELSALSLGDDVQLRNADDTADAEFDSTVYVYTALVPYSTTSVTVTATPEDADDGATYAVTSDEDDDVQNGVVDLAEGENVITVKVTAADKVTTSDSTGKNAYMVTVTRAPRSESTNATLDILTLTYDHDDDTNTDNLVQTVPGFASGRVNTNGYIAPVAHTVGTVTLNATASFRNATGITGALGPDEDEAADQADAETANDHIYTSPAITLLPEGQDTVIWVTVTAEDGVSKATYKVTVRRAVDTAGSVEDGLSALSLMVGGDELEITQPDGTTTGFLSTENTYTVDVPYSAASVTVMATTTNRGASYVVTSDKDSSVRGGVVDLDQGANIITVKVTAASGPETTETDDDCEGTDQDENIQCYTVTVTRALSTAPRVTTLSVLSIAEQSTTSPTVSAFMPAFAANEAPASGGYMAYAANGVSTVNLTATASHSGASVAVTAGADEDSATAVSDLTATPLQATGDTVILITVTAADGFAKATYKLTVKVGASGSNVVTLDALSLMDAASNDITIVDSDPATVFTVADCLTTAATPCTARVRNATTSVTVTAEPTDEDNGATYAVTSDKDSSTQGGMVDLAEGANVITVKVTAADRVTTSDSTGNAAYRVTVTRVASGLSIDTTLATLTIADTDDTATDLLDPTFVSNSMPVEGGYAAEIAILLPR